MIKISAAEAEKLHKMGVKYGENGISVTHSHHVSRYVAETSYNLERLKKIRQV